MLLSFSWTAKASDQKKVDSLFRSLSASIPDTQRVTVLVELARALVDYPDSSFVYASKAHQLATEIKYEFGIARSLASMGEVYNGKGNYSMALKVLHEAYDHYERMGNKAAMCTVMNSIGNTHIGNKDNAKGLDAFKKCFYLAKEMKDEKGIALSSFGIGNIYGTDGKIDSAMKYLDVALPAFAAQKYTYAEGMTYALIGQLRNSEKKYAESLAALDKAMELFNQVGQLYGVGVAYQAIGKTYYDMGEKGMALNNYIKAYEVHMKRNAFDNIKESALAISQTFKDLGDYESALAYHEKYMIYNDSVFNQQSRKQLLEVETKYMTADKEKEIKLKTLELETSAEKVRSRTVYLFIFAGASVILLILAFFAYKQYRQKKVANLRVMLQKNIIEEKNKSITESIRYAQYIQGSILPDDDMIYYLLGESFVLYRPKDIVSGDFYWSASVENYTYVAVVDCTGHGVPGAFMSMVGYNALGNAIKQLKTPDTSQVLSFLQEEVKEMFRHNYNSGNVRDGMDISLVRLDKKEKKIQFSGANIPLCLVREKEMIQYRGDKAAISAHRETKVNAFTTHTIDLQKGDSIYLFSDGYADQFGGPKGKKFKHKNFQALMKANAHLPMYEQKNVFSKTIDDWKGDHEQIDDILVIGFRI